MRGPGKRWLLLITALVLAFTFLAGRSLHHAFEEIQTYPEHRGGYERYGASGFIQRNIGTEARIRERLLDADLVLMYDYGRDIGKQYNPLFIAGFVLSLVPLAEKRFPREVLFANLDFLLENSVHEPGGGLLFPYRFDFVRMQEHAPWYSSMAQARIAEALMWGYRLEGDARFLVAAKRALFALEADTLEVPLGIELGKGLWLKEFPAYDFHVLDGTLVAIVGVHQVYLGLPEADPDRERIGRLFDRSLVGFKQNWPCFAAPMGGVYFADDRSLPTQSYYDIIMRQLGYLERSDPEIGPIAAAYSLEGQTMIGKVLTRYWTRWSRKVLQPLGLVAPCVR